MNTIEISTGYGMSSCPLTSYSEARFNAAPYRDNKISKYFSFFWVKGVRKHWLKAAKYTTWTVISKLKYNKTEWVSVLVWKKYIYHLSAATWKKEMSALHLLKHPHETILWKSFDLSCTSVCVCSRCQMAKYSLTLTAHPVLYPPPFTNCHLTLEKKWLQLLHFGNCSDNIKTLRLWTPLSWRLGKMVWGAEHLNWRISTLRSTW